MDNTSKMRLFTFKTLVSKIYILHLLVVFFFKLYRLLHKHIGVTQNKKYLSTFWFRHPSSPLNYKVLPPLRLFKFASHTFTVWTNEGPLCSLFFSLFWMFFAGLLAEKTSKYICSYQDKWYSILGCKRNQTQI